MHMSPELRFILVKCEDQSQVKGYVEKAYNYGKKIIKVQRFAIFDVTSIGNEIKCDID